MKIFRSPHPERLLLRIAKAKRVKATVAIRVLVAKIVDAHKKATEVKLES